MKDYRKVDGVDGVDLVDGVGRLRPVLVLLVVGVLAGVSLLTADPTAQLVAVARAKANAGAATVNVSWTAPAAGGPEVLGYRIYKSTDSGATFSLLETVANTETDADVEAEVDDQLYITAYNDGGESVRDADEALADGIIITIE